ncbi:hypothetical protein D3C86_1294840 [compost metagenome]
MLYFTSLDTILYELHLRALAAIQQEKMILHLHYLGTRITTMRRYSGIITQYGYFQDVTKLEFVQ